MIRYSYTSAFLLVLLSMMSLKNYAQNVEFVKSNFPGKKEELKEALKKLEVGTDLYQQGRREFDDARKSFLTENRYLPMSHHDHRRAGYELFRSALNPLKEANVFNPNNFEVNYMLGFIWFNTEPVSNETVRYFEKAYNLSPPPGSDIRFWLAWTYHLNSKWDEAIKLYKEQLAILLKKPKNNVGNIEDINRKYMKMRIT